MKRDERRLRLDERDNKAVLYGTSPAVIFESAWVITKSSLTRVMTGFGFVRSRPWIRVALHGWETYYSKREGG